MSEADKTAQAPEPKPWMAQMPDEYKKDARLAQYDGPMAHVPLALVKGYLGREDEYGKLKAAYDSVEKPPEEYALEEVKLPEDVELEGLEDQRKAFVAQMKEVGATNKQANALWKKAVENTVAEVKSTRELEAKLEAEDAAATKAAADKVAQTLKAGDGNGFKGWGDNYDAEMRHVKLGLEKFAPKGADGKPDPLFFAREMKDGTKLGDSVPVVLMFHEIGRRMAEAEEIVGRPGGTKEETPEQRAARMYPETPTKATVQQAQEASMPDWAKEIYASSGR